MKKFSLAVLVVFMAVSIAGAETWVSVSEKINGGVGAHIDIDSIKLNTGHSTPYISARVKWTYEERFLREARTKWGQKTDYVVDEYIVSPELKSPYDHERTQYRYQILQQIAYTGDGKVVKRGRRFSFNPSYYYEAEKGTMGATICKYILEHQK